MILLLFSSVVFFFTAVDCHYESAEVNRLEITPFYDAIIFSDVADVINEFQNNLNLPVEEISIGSESEESIDDLLTEYQHYLDKAHKQRLNYYEKTKTKNKVPALRHDRFSKTKPGPDYKYDDNYYSTNYYNPNINKFFQPYNSPLDLFIPFSPKFKYPSKPELPTPQIKEDETSSFDKKLIVLPPPAPKLKHDPAKPSCVCKNLKICEKCGKPLLQNNMARNALTIDDEFKPLVQTSEYIPDDKARDLNENTLNIRIKVDIQLPKTQDFLNKLVKNRSREEDPSNTDTKISSFNVPFPNLNFPIPMDFLGLKKTQKYNKHEHSPLHKITIHKKKKSKNNINRHRKKLVAFHNVQTQAVNIPYNEEMYNFTTYDQKINDSHQLNSTQTAPIDMNITTERNKLENIASINVSLSNKTEEPLIVNETQTEENIYLMVNISNSCCNGTEDVNKTENSVEVEFAKIESNIPTEKPITLRKKRETSGQLLNSTSVRISNTSQITTKRRKHRTEKILGTTPTVGTEKILESVPKVGTANKQETVPRVATEKISETTPKAIETRKVDKHLLADAELLYWPTNPKNYTSVPSKNITMIILEREHKKTKLNTTKDTLRHNHTKILERAIFGDVNWDDVDTVAPVFLSFVGKYIRGVLTFCSQNICHSMKCAEKTCIHRTCAPNDRWNHRGHCGGFNSTESVASLESIMDLPSNVAFEIVDILQSKMLGKLFGKVTLCISSKCISFVASKKNFLKSRCSTKELGKLGHCPNVKTVKLV